MTGWVSDGRGWRRFHVSHSDISRSANVIVLGVKDAVVMLKIFMDEDETVQCGVICRVSVGEQVSHVKISPDGVFIAVGDVHGTLHIITQLETENKKKEWGIAGICAGQQGEITAVDWSAAKYQDSHIIRSWAHLQDCFYWNPSTLEHLPDIHEVRNLSWSSDNCMTAAPVIGVWYSKQASTGCLTSIDTNHSKTLVGVGDDRGSVSLFTYPCLKKGMYCHSYQAHRSVHMVRFSACGSHLLTTGQNDCCLIQWLLV